MTSPAPDRFEAVLEQYRRWLRRQPLSPRTRQTYLERVRGFIDWLSEQPPREGGDDPLRDAHARDYAVRDYKRFLKRRRAAPRTVNLSLAALDHFYRHRGLEAPNVRREDLPAAAPRALSEDALRQFLRSVERSGRVRDQAIASVLVNTAIRLSELVALDVDDVALSARKGKLVVRSGKGDAHREIPLNVEARRALDAWLGERSRQFPESQSPALFLARTGSRLSARSVDSIVRALGRDGGLRVSAHTLRHTCLTQLVRAGHDLVLVAEVAGHRRLETTRRYSLPTEADRAAAMESIPIEY